MNIKRRLFIGAGATMALSSAMVYARINHAPREANPPMPTQAPATSADAGHGVSAKLAATQDKYTCSMHPRVMSDKPGNCPICNMRLVKVKPT
ncbi:heavy metal-binding domain-containing protein [Herbaspirillum sp. ST 5-3]|uniref:heavy metal-binding domain-containing protein n=1 Tax=Oxalobacteraceae TaxID=75682 RepID=UPI0010A3BEEE|nr:heavy metal-binding domain-containing protein [Herbaspirillum sp. ST 5-3]